MSKIGVGLVRQSQISLLRFERKFDPVLSRVEETQAQLNELKNTYATLSYPTHYGYNAEYKLPLNMLELLQFIQQQRPKLKRSKKNLLKILSPLTLLIFPVGMFVERPIFFRKMVSEFALYDALKTKLFGSKEEPEAFYKAFEIARQFLKEKGLIQTHWNGFENVPSDGFLDDRRNWFSVEAIALTRKAEALLEYA